MAQPFFRGNYGSALSQVDTRPIIEAGRARGQMFANMGAQLGGMIQQYGLNKEKRAELTGEIEAMLPRYMQELTMSGNEDSDKKNMLRIEKFNKGDSSMSDLKGLAGELAMKDKVQARIAQNEATEIANQTNRFNLGLAQELKDANIKLKQNEALTSDIGVAVARMKKEDFKAIRDPALKEKLAQLRDAAGVRAADPASGQAMDARKLRKFQISALERVDSIESLVADTLGLEKMAEMKIEDMKTLSKTNKAKLETAEALTGYYKAKGIADLITAANKNSPSFSDRFKPLVEMTGKILSTNVKVPGSNKRVTFNEYLELHEEDSDKYPLNKLAGDLNAQLLSLESQTQNVLRAQPVPVAVPDETVTPSEKSASELIARDLIPPMLNPAQEQGALNIAGNITSAIPQVISDEALEQLAQEFLDKTNPDAAKILPTPRGQEAFQRLMQKRQASGLGRGAIGI